MPKEFPKYKNRIFTACVFAVVLSLLFFPSVFAGIKDLTVRTLTAPFTVYKKLERHFRSRDRLIESNKALRKRVADLSLKIARLDDICRENVRLRALLQFKEKFDFKTISAEVIAREPDDWRGAFIIDRGLRDGMKTRAAVCSAKGLLGKVVEAGIDTSLVILLTHPNFKAGGVIKGSRINGVITGAGKGMAKMLYIPMSADVETGAVVTTSGLSRIFPKGILVGEIVSVEKSRTGLYKYAMIRPFADLFDEEEVLCVVDI
ncbi:MAG: rod shape-determining protein MreC [Candidatus Omnitrophica bacterium]|nr:rod shape-determining protein MreC [Candidatus Omnitrophota bacterium]